MVRGRLPDVVNEPIQFGCCFSITVRGLAFRDGRVIRHVLAEFAYPICPSRLHRTLPPVAPDKLPSGANPIHEIKHDGYRLMARRDPVGIQLLTRNGHGWSAHFPPHQRPGSFSVEQAMEKLRNPPSSN